jgi:hypothetical protein
MTQKAAKAAGSTAGGGSKAVSKMSSSRRGSQVV